MNDSRKNPTQTNLLAMCRRTTEIRIAEQTGTSRGDRSSISVLVRSGSPIGARADGSDPDGEPGPRAFE